MINKSTLFIVNNIDKSLEDISSTLPRHSVRVIRNETQGKNEFLIDEAKKAIKEAYIATSETKYYFYNHHYLKKFNTSNNTFKSRSKVSKNKENFTRVFFKS